MTSLRETASLFSNSPGVQELTPSNFGNGGEIRYQGYAIVLYYVPWCGFCRRISPLWKQLGTFQKRCKIMSLNCEQYKDIVDKINTHPNEVFQVKSYPTIIIYKHGKPYYQYIGERDLKTIVQTLKKIEGTM